MSFMYLCLCHECLTLLICSGLVDGGTSVSDIKLPCRTHPHWLEPTIYQSETPPERSSTPSEGIGLEARSMVSVAVKISSQNAERNVKVECIKITDGWKATLAGRTASIYLGKDSVSVELCWVSHRSVSCEPFHHRAIIRWLHLNSV